MSIPRTQNPLRDNKSPCGLTSGFTVYFWTLPASQQPSSHPSAKLALIPLRRRFTWNTPLFARALVAHFQSGDNPWQFHHFAGAWPGPRMIRYSHCFLSPETIRTAYNNIIVLTRFNLISAITPPQDPIPSRLQSEPQILIPGYCYTWTWQWWMVVELWWFSCNRKCNISTRNQWLYNKIVSESWWPQRSPNKLQWMCHHPWRVKAQWRELLIDIVVLSVAQTFVWVKDVPVIV